MHIITNISRRNGKQALKFGQLIKYSKRNVFFFKNQNENEIGKLGPDLSFFFFEKNLL